MTFRDQWRADVAVLRANLWENREELLDYLLLHDCVLHVTAQASVRMVAWQVDDFILAALMDEPARLRFTVED